MTGRFLKTLSFFILNILICGETLKILLYTGHINVLSKTYEYSSLLIILNTRRRYIFFRCFKHFRISNKNKFSFFSEKHGCKAKSLFVNKPLKLGVDLLFNTRR